MESVDVPVPLPAVCCWPSPSCSVSPCGVHHVEADAGDPLAGCWGDLDARGPGDPDPQLGLNKPSSCSSGPGVSHAPRRSGRSIARQLPPAIVIDGLQEHAHPHRLRRAIAILGGVIVVDRASAAAAERRLANALSCSPCCAAVLAGAGVHHPAGRPTHILPAGGCRTSRRWDWAICSSTCSCLASRPPSCLGIVARCSAPPCSSPGPGLTSRPSGPWHPRPALPSCLHNTSIAAHRGRVAAWVSARRGHLVEACSPALVSVASSSIQSPSATSRYPGRVLGVALVFVVLNLASHAPRIATHASGTDLTQTSVVLRAPARCTP